MAITAAGKNAALVWNTTRLDATLLAAFKRSLPAAQARAKATAPNSKSGAKTIGVSATSLATARATLAPTGLGTIFEVGRQGGYPIVPGGVTGLRRTKAQSGSFNLSDQFGRNYRLRSKRGGSSKALKFSRGDGGFAAYALGGSMRAEPYIKPTGAWWVNGGFQAIARAQMTAGGFGSVKR